MSISKKEPDFIDFLEAIEIKKQIKKQAELAHYLGLSQSIVSQIKNYKFEHLAGLVERINEENNMNVLSLERFSQEEFGFDLQVLLRHYDENKKVCENPLLTSADIVRSSWYYRTKPFLPHLECTWSLRFLTPKHLLRLPDIYLSVPINAIPKIASLQTFDKDDIKLSFLSLDQIQPKKKIVVFRFQKELEPNTLYGWDTSFFVELERLVSSVNNIDLSFLFSELIQFVPYNNLLSNGMNLSYLFEFEERLGTRLSFDFSPGSIEHSSSKELGSNVIHRLEWERFLGEGVQSFFLNIVCRESSTRSSR